MALIVFVAGLFVSINGWQTNKEASATVAHLSKTAAKSGNASPTVPSTTKPTTNDLASYAVAPTLPRYLRIPKLGVEARVLRLGVDKSGQLETPPNVYDTGWYDASSLPGSPGAMLIDGHVSSWTTNGVFYGLKKLVPGDTMTVERGDGQTFTYKVVKTQAYDADNVDMQAAVTPVVPGKPGLNLITCTGSVKPGTSEFTQRLVVFTVQE